MLPFLLALHKTLPEDAFPWVAGALWHDPPTWSALHSPLGEESLHRFGGNPLEWSPAALMALAESLPSLNLPEEFAAALTLCRRLAALRADQGSWEGLQTFLKSESPPPHVLHSAAACLLGRVASPDELLTALTASDEGARAALHAVLSQPKPPSAQAVAVSRLIALLPPERALPLLWELHRSHPELARKAATHARLTAPTQTIAHWQAALASPAETSAEAMQTARESAARLLGIIAAQQAEAAAESGNFTAALEAWKAALSALPQNEEYRAGYAFALTEAHSPESTLRALPTGKSAAVLAARAYALHLTDPAAARTLALDVTDRLNDFPLPPYLHTALVDVLVAVGEMEAAARAALLAAQRAPYSAEAFTRSAALFSKTENWQAAAEAAFWANSLEPSPARLRLFADAALRCCRAEALDAYRRLTAENPRSEDLLTLASLAEEQGKHEEARRAAQAVLTDDAENPTALTILGQAEAAAGNLEAARAHFERSLATEPTAAAYLALADVVHEQEGLDAALETLRRGASLFPHSAELHHRLGALLLEANRPAHAIPHLRTALDEDPANPKIALTLSQALAALGRYDEVKETLEKANARGIQAARLLAKASLHLGDPLAAKRALSPHIEAGEASAADLLAYAKALLALNEHSQAADAAQRALEQIGASDNENPALRAEILSALGESLLAQGKTAEALEAYTEAHRSLPAEETALKVEVARGLVRAAVAAQSPQSAVEALEDTLPLAPHDAELHSLAAKAYAEAGMLEEALNAAYAACVLKDFAADEVSAYAKLAVAQGKAGEAAEILRQALARAPKNHALRLALADALIAAQDPAAAVSALLPLLEVDLLPDAETCAEAGSRLLALGSPAEAADCLRRAVQMRPEAPLGWHIRLVQALRAAEQHSEAAEAAQFALARSDFSENESALPLHIALVESLLAIGERERAAKALREATRALPNSAELQRAAARLWQEARCLRCALEAAERYLAAHPQDWAMRAQAGETARRLLMPERARHILTPLPDEDSAEIAACRILRAEIALDAGEEVAAAQDTQAAIAAEENISPNGWKARLLALQTRLAARAQKPQHAEMLLAEALEKAAAASEESGVLGAVAEAAAELGNWQTAWEFAQRAAQAFPNSPLDALRVARFAVLIAEAQERAAAVDAVKHASVIPEDLRARWQESLTQAARALDLPDGSTAAHPELQRWRARGEAVFHNRAAKALLPTARADDVAAWWGALRRSDDEANPIIPPLEHPLVAFNVALYLEKRHLPADALRAADAAIRLKPHFAEAHALAARLAFRLKDYDRAAGAIRSALAIYDDEPRWHALAGKIFAASDAYEEAAERFARAAELEPNHPPHWLALAEALFQSGKAQEAVNALRQSERDFPNSAAVQAAIAELLLELGRLDEAAVHAKKALEANPSAETLLLRARIAERAGDYQTALEAARRARKKRGLTPEIAAQIARALAGLGKPKEALAVVKEALSRADSQSKPRLEILHAELLSATGDASAVDAWRRLSRAYPKDARVWLGLAETLAAANNAAEAQRAARRALSLVDGLEPTEQSRVFLLLGRLAAQEGHLDQAVHYLTEATRAAPNSAEAWLALGRAQAERGLFKEAMNAYERARMLDPRNPLPYYHAALAAREVSDFETAEKLLEEAARLDPDNVAIQRQLAAVRVINLVHG